MGTCALSESEIVATFAQIVAAKLAGASDLCISSSGDVLCFTAPVVVPRETVLELHSPTLATLSGNKSNRLFVVDGQLALTRLVMVHGSALVCNPPHTDCAGGTIHVGAQGLVVLMSCTIKRSTAINRGALFVSAGGLAFVALSTFTGNSAFSGGAIEVSAEGAIFLTDSNFTLNTAAQFGGALQLSDVDTFGESSTTIRRSSFERNGALYGAGVFSGRLHNVRIDACSFILNVVARGTLFIGSLCTATVTNENPQV